jgi:hypothetical protein
MIPHPRAETADVSSNDRDTAIPTQLRGRAMDIRTLIRGPKEFRNIRADLPEPI